MKEKMIARAFVEDASVECSIVSGAIKLKDGMGVKVEVHYGVAVIIAYELPEPKLEGKG